MNFKEQLQNRGAREFQIVALSGDEDRALAAIAEAERRGIEHVVPYAITLYEDPSWSPTGARSRPPQITNTFADVKCATCGGDRWISVLYDPLVPYAETYKPCLSCNAAVDASFWKVNGERFVVQREYDIPGAGQAGC